MPPRPSLVVTAALVLGGCPLDVEDPVPGFGSGETGELPATSSGGPGPSDSTGSGAPLPSTGTTGSMGSVCGNGVIEGLEECDCGGERCTPAGLDEVDCSMLEDPKIPGPLTGGVLGCNPASCRFDTSQCTWCGNREIDGNEQCEPTVAITATCASLDAGAAGDVVCDGQCQLDTTGCTPCGVVFEFDDPEDWIAQQLNAGAPAPSWEWGTPTAGVGPGTEREGVWATNLSGDYDDDESSALRSPPITLSGCSQADLEIRVRHWMSFEATGPVITDGGNLQRSESPLTGFMPLVPVSGTLYDKQPLGTTFSPPDGQPGFHGYNPDEGVWTESRFRLDAFATFDPLYLRFVFGSDQSVTDYGWYIDRVELLEIE